MRGSTPATPDETIRASGFKLYFFMAPSDAIKTAHAPSFTPEEFPAVTVPSFLNAGFSFDKISIEVFGFINSSSLTIIASPFFCAIETGMISFLKRPAFFATRQDFLPFRPLHPHHTFLSF